jgi:hypothetical protein
VLDGESHYIREILLSIGYLRIVGAMSGVRMDILEC